MAPHPVRPVSLYDMMIIDSNFITAFNAKNHLISKNVSFFQLGIFVPFWCGAWKYIRI